MVAETPAVDLEEDSCYKDSKTKGEDRVAYKPEAASIISIVPVAEY